MEQTKKEEYANILAVVQDTAYNILNTDSRPWGQQGIVLRRLIISIVNHDHPEIFKGTIRDLEEITDLASDWHNCHAACQAVLESQLGLLRGYSYENYASEAQEDYNKPIPKITFLWNGIRASDCDHLQKVYYSKEYCENLEVYRVETIDEYDRFSGSVQVMANAFNHARIDTGATEFYDYFIVSPSSKFFVPVKTAYLKSELHFAERMVKKYGNDGKYGEKYAKEAAEYQAQLNELKNIKYDYKAAWCELMYYADADYNGRLGKELDDYNKQYEAFKAKEKRTHDALTGYAERYPITGGNYATIKWSEAPGIPENFKLSFAALDAFIIEMQGIPREGYGKTEIVLTFADGTTYEMRFDIGSDSDTIGEHIRSFADWGFKIDEQRNFPAGKEEACKIRSDYYNVASEFNNIVYGRRD